MNGLDYRRATALVYDPVHVNLRTTRYALHEIGFREIQSLSSLDELRRRLEDETPALIMAETTGHEAEVIRLVRGIRAGDVARNPFVCIILTCWVRDGAALKRAIGSGADDIIIRPFSTAFAEERIRTLIKARKPFVVTSDYIGPDRRTDPERGAGSARSILAPNTLKAIAEGEEGALDQAHAWIAEARATVENERIRRLAMRIVVGAEVGVRELEAGRRPEIDIADFERTAQEMRLRLMRQRAAEAVHVAKALCDLCARMRGEAGMTAANLNLLKELATGSYAAFGGGRAIESSRDEIEKTVAALQKRLASATQPDGGVTLASALKRRAK